MKNLLCYLGIMFALFLIALPPVLRITLPDKEEEKKMVVETSILLCTNDKYMISTNYENESVRLIMIKKLLSDDREDLEDSELDKLYDSLKTDDEITYSVVDDGEIAKIDFKTSNHENLTTLSSLTNTMKNQQAYYQKNDLICQVR